MLTVLLFFGSATFLAWFFVHSDRGAKEPTGALWAAFGFGVVSFGLALVLEQPLASVLHNIQVLPAFYSLDTIFLAALAIGVIEESAKFLPLAFFIRSRRYFNEHTDGVIYFGLAGLGFSLLENLAYFNSFGASAGLLRVILLLFFHSATAATVGYFFARAKLNHEGYFKTGLALLAMMLLHGLYDFGLFSQRLLFIYISLMLTALINTALFLFYQQGTEDDQAMGLAAVGHNRFCRHCGWPNPQHLLYCEHCGAKS